MTSAHIHYGLDSRKSMLDKDIFDLRSHPSVADEEVGGKGVNKYFNCNNFKLTNNCACHPQGDLPTHSWVDNKTACPLSRQPSISVHV